MQPEETARKGLIMIVDDNAVSRLKLAHTVEAQGHTADQAQNGHEALEKLPHRPYDVVLLDLLMPEMDGFQVLQAIKANPDLRDIVVIVISALDKMDSIVRCIHMGAEDYLPKPYDPVLLQARLQTSLERKQLRDLERAYFQQELMLRQSEKLATLGKLSAGIAHELNNPAAAAQRSASYLLTAVGRLQQAQLNLDMYGLSGSQRAALLHLMERAEQRAAEPLALDPLTSSDRQDEVEQWLEEQGVEHGWEYAPELVALGYEQTALRRLGMTFGKAQLPAVIAWISATFTLYTLAHEIQNASGRVAQIVKALKGYTYLDQAPIQQVNIHEGLEGTLLILANKLRDGIEIVRDYTPKLPPVEGYGSELNQVWTNLIDNAAEAMGGHGRLTLRTRQENGWVIVEIEDGGPGIPAEIQPKIFDPFFTTKSPGEGTGLGLNISHNIIVQKHKGQITVTSRPGQTRFQVRLPLHQ